MKSLLMIIVLSVSLSLNALDAPVLGNCWIPGSSWGNLACEWFTCSWSSVVGADQYEWEAYTNGWDEDDYCSYRYGGNPSSEWCRTNTAVQQDPEVTYFFDVQMGIMPNTTAKKGRVRAIDLVPQQVWNPILHQWVTIYLPFWGPWSNEGLAALPMVCRY